VIAGLVGRLFRAFGRLRGGDAGHDLAEVGDELVELERGRRQPPTSER